MVQALKDLTVVRDNALNFATTYFSKNSVAPSVRKLTRALGVSVGDFYRAFPDGIRELCQAANIPFEQERFMQTTEALSTRAASHQAQSIATSEDKGVGSEVSAWQIPPVTLTHKQS